MHWARLPRYLCNLLRSLYELNDVYIEEFDSVQKLLEIQGWLLLTFFICLRNQSGKLF